MARRRNLIAGKEALAAAATATSATTTATTAPVPPDATCNASSCHATARAMRAQRAQIGRGKAGTCRPSGRMRNPEPIKYPPKVAASTSYAGQKVTGVRIGRGVNMTGNEPGAEVQITGSQYLGTEGGFNPREFGVKVGAQRTTAGQVVTGTQVRSKIMITGDESNPALRITGEADQELGDDLLQRREQGTHAVMQFQRQNNPHGHSVFGANLGRSMKSIGSRERDRTRVAESTDGGLPVSGTAVGRSGRVTGDESGACRHVTGDQYLMPATKQSLCTNPAMGAPKVGVSHTLHGARTTGTQVGQRLRARGGITGNAEDGACKVVSGDEYIGAEQYQGQCGAVPAAAGGEKVKEAETWRRQRITGVDVEHNTRVTGDEPGVCSSITGTPYAGPAQYETFCETDATGAAAQRVAPEAARGNRVTGDTPINLERITGTQRGSDRLVTGTPYYRDDVEDDMNTNIIEHINSSFTVTSPQRESQLRAGTEGVKLPTAEARITGTFAVGEGKITGNQEFRFRPRLSSHETGELYEQKPLISGEGKFQGTEITGNAWFDNPRVTGTEGYIASERNPSERMGRRHGFASATAFKGKHREVESQHAVTGSNGWVEKSTARITLSGGSKG